MGRHGAGVKACAVLEDGRLVTGGFDGKVCMYLLAYSSAFEDMRLR